MPECPICGTHDEPLKQTTNLFVCPFCTSLYSVVNIVESGIAKVAVTVYNTESRTMQTIN